MAKSNFEIKRVSGAPVTDEELLNDLRRVSTISITGKVTQRIYDEHGKYDSSNIGRRFGTWNKALRQAGLSISNENDISDDRLFENILALWQHFGRQPRRSELAFSPSTISQTPYNRRFESWTSALKAFVAFANEGVVESPIIQHGEEATRRAAGRGPSLRLRWHVLQRDRFTCCACGASPALIPGVELHVDHIVPWSKGGETVIDNLQSLCSVCNLGKSNGHQS